jgi:hypothetical protein
MPRAALRLVPQFIEFVRDQKGQVLILFTILVPVMLGMIGLALEGGRFLMLNSQLQDLADAAALAGAKELNGATDAIARATSAAENVLNNPCTSSNDFQPCWSFADGLYGVQIVDPPVFYSALKGAPSDNPAEKDVITDDATQANYIKVTTVSRDVIPVFLTAMGATRIGQTSATATAGTTYVACNVQPLMLCNPFQTLGSGIEFSDAVKNGTVKPGMMFHLKVLNSSNPGGGNQSFAPGDFGLLDPPGENSSGANTIRNLLSSQSPNFCYIDNVSPRTGQAVQKVSDGINVRFDLPVNGNTTGLDQSPAPDVIKGLVPRSGQVCSGQYNDLGATARLPLDTSWTNIGNMQIGNGSMVFPNSYWQYHHGANWPSDLLALGQPNRYLAYQREISMFPMNKPGTETPIPVCNSPTNESTAQRRIIAVAVTDCLNADGTPKVIGNSTANMRVNSYMELFITQPSLNYSNLQGNGEVWGEFVRLITPQSSGGKLHQIVQLYRDCDPTVTPGCH